jgi:hypothetical protein
MGLKKDAPVAPGEDNEAAVKAQTPPPEQPPTKAPTKAPAKAPVAAKAAGKGTTNTFARAVTYPIADPMTLIKYQLNISMPAAVKEGNWVDCQIKAGVLREVAQDAPPEEKKGK